MPVSKKLQRDIESTSASKLLVICIDRDDDIGKKAGIVSPVVGRNACLEAAQRLALEAVSYTHLTLPTNREV